MALKCGSSNTLELDRNAHPGVCSDLLERESGVVPSNLWVNSSPRSSDAHSNLRTTYGVMVTRRIMRVSGVKHWDKEEG